MSKVFGMHAIALRPGVKPQDFEKFVVQKVYPVYAETKDFQMHLLKGDRGDREGKYLVMFEFPSVAARDGFFPALGEASEQAREIMARYQQVTQEWDSYATPLDIMATDYEVVGE